MPESTRVVESGRYHSTALVPCRRRISSPGFIVIFCRFRFFPLCVVIRVIV